MCIEHISGFWTIKPLTRRGQVENFAFVEGGCAFHACGSRVWKKLDGSCSWIDQPGIRMMIILDAADLRHSDTPNVRLSDAVEPDGSQFLVVCEDIQAGTELTIDTSTLIDGKKFFVSLTC
jgi:hypothetical protein